MRRVSTMRYHAHSATAALLVLCCAVNAYGADSYSPSNKELTISRVAIGSAVYSDMVVTVGTIVSGPSGTSADGLVDSYDPGTNQLTVQAVSVGSATYYNVIVTVTGLVSIGSVIGADSYNGTDLDISHVQLGGTTYDGVAVAESLGDVLSLAGGMPTFATDTYDALSNQLAIPAVQVGNRVFTNVVVTPGQVASVAGIYATVQEAIVHSFSGQHGNQGLSGSTDGADPALGAGLILGSDGNFYGTTLYGGAADAGTVFVLTPQGTESVVYSFTGNVNGSLGPDNADGANPAAGLVQDSAGNLYGTTQNGGANGYGTVFRINPDHSETVLYSFCPVYPCEDGENPTAGLVMGSDGNLYGVAAGGGARSTGTVFRISPTGSFDLLYTFLNNLADAAAPGAALTQAADGNLYGTSAAGGAYGSGAVYRVTLAGAEAVIYSFCASGPSGNGCTDGAAPNAGLIQATDGNLYGMTSSGGAYHSGGNTGTVFRITTAGDMTILHSFCGEQLYSPCVDAGYPVGTLIQANDGNFYGATRNGGANNYGALFKLTPTGVETLSFSFQGDNNTNTSGLEPSAGLVQASDGSFYGITDAYGAYGEGEIYHVTNLVPLQ